MVNAIENFLADSLQFVGRKNAAKNQTRNYSYNPIFKYAFYSKGVWLIGSCQEAWILWLCIIQFYFRCSRVFSVFSQLILLILFQDCFWFSDSFFGLGREHFFKIFKICLKKGGEVLSEIMVSLLIWFQIEEEKNRV